MGFKSKQKNKTFSDLEKSSDRKNKALFTLMELDKTVSWDKIEAAFLRDYPVGQKKEGNKAYSPLFLFKCLLLQKWYQIKSDPEIESQINDRESFQTFLKLSSQEKFPDHSTFSIFRKRLTREKFDIIVGDILNRFAEKGISINKGIAIDARIVRSASKSVSNRTLDKIRKERQTPEGTLDKNGNPNYGLKEHASVDAKHGFVLSTVMSPASVHDTNCFVYSTLYSRRGKHRLTDVYADKAYAGEPNRTFPSMNKLNVGIMRKDEINAKLTDYEISRNKKIPKVRYIAEQYFGLSHLQDDSQRARFTCIVKNNIDIWFRQVAFNIKRGLRIFLRMAVA